MDYLYEKSVGKKSALVAPKEIQDYLAPKDELTVKEIEFAVKNLMIDGYIDVFHSDNRGQLNYVISLKTRGEGYQREKKDARDRRIRSLGWKIFIAFVASVAVWIFWRIVGR